MQSAFRSMGWEDRSFLTLCVVVSLAAHVVLMWLLLPGGGSSSGEVQALGERFATEVNRATDLNARTRARVEEGLARLEPSAWARGTFVDTFQWQASHLDLAVTDADLVRALDPERSREGRWDVRAWLDWGDDRTVADLLVLAYLAGEGTLKSDFGSHRFWVHLQAPEGAGRVAFETMDCRLYRAGKLPASDLLHRATWMDR